MEGIELISNLIRYLTSMLPLPQEFRARLYACTGVNIGKQVIIDRGVQVTRAENIYIGAGHVFAPTFQFSVR